MSSGASSVGVQVVDADAKFDLAGGQVEGKAHGKTRCHDSRGLRGLDADLVSVNVVVELLAVGIVGDDGDFDGGLEISFPVWYSTRGHASRL